MFVRARFVYLFAFTCRIPIHNSIILHLKLCVHFGVCLYEICNEKRTHTHSDSMVILYCAPQLRQFGVAIFSTKCHKIWPSALSFRRIGQFFCFTIVFCHCHFYHYSFWSILFALYTYFILLLLALMSIHTAFESFFSISFTNFPLFLYSCCCCCRFFV